MRLLDATARTTASITLAALVVGHGFVLPLLTAPGPLLDANLARAVAGPLELRIADVAAFGCLLTACLVPRWIGRPGATTLALVATALAAFDRLLVLPRLHAGWSRVDLVARRPVALVAEAELLAYQHLAVVAGVGLAMLGVIAMAEFGRGAPAPKVPEAKLAETSSGGDTALSPVAGLATPARAPAPG